MNDQSKILRKTAKFNHKNSNTDKKNASEMLNDSKKPRGEGKIHEYPLDTELVDLFKNILTIEKEKAEKYKKGEKISPVQQTKLDKTKAKIMREIAYPSMANLMVLFSKLAKNPILRKSFRREVRELIGMNGLQKALGHYEGSGPSFVNSFKDNNFAGLLLDIIMSLKYDIEVDSEKKPKDMTEQQRKEAKERLKKEKEKQLKNDYTGFFLYQIQCCIAEPLINMIYSNQGYGNKASKQVADKLIEARDYIPTIINDSIKTKLNPPLHDKISI